MELDRWLRTAVTSVDVVWRHSISTQFLPIGCKGLRWMHMVCGRNITASAHLWCLWLKKTVPSFCTWYSREYCYTSTKTQLKNLQVQVSRAVA